ncbi:negative regulatory protein YxlE [Paenibacillus baekrokdamisoli]|uniref:Negative regulatory protein YxlE n=1 Tax=Paenibacillus baekrokdamisoli TaxID=1712516 RepID=A0A3G9JNR7_9BACL|nr:PLD nuclease N-terminal domain-containing protein [Paenibacillus baekrokdamisoli]MBB3071285.1 membrane protein DedA with SNARE-associated domain [Paenibacillus baekrokdamisoli]BBH24679.1 negative regulatory protein YxlE [Paenibacillus baekrokdamisoli]
MSDLSTTQLMTIVGPIVVIQLILMLTALVVCIRTEETRGPKWIWVLAIILGSLIGPILFFVMGRRST